MKTTSGTSRSPLVERVAGWSTRHRAVAIIGWFVLVICSLAAGHVLGPKDHRTYDPGESGRAQRMMDDAHGSSPPGESVLIQSRGSGGYDTDPQLSNAVRDVVATLHQQHAGSVGDIRSPLDSGAKGLLSSDRRSALVIFTVTDPSSDSATAIVPIQNAVQQVQKRHPGVLVVESGNASISRAVDQTVSKDFRRARESSLPLTMLILLIVFGSLIAAGIPMLLAGTAVMAALGLLNVAGHWMPVAKTASSVVLLVGMAVGVDYTLFYLRREREERATHNAKDALRVTSRTSGQAILVSGLTVMVALAGLLLTGITVFTGLALGTICVVGLAMVGSVTVLPALLALLGGWVDRARIPWLGRRRTAARSSRMWTGLARRVVRHPMAWGGIALIALAALAVPAASMRLGDPDLLHELPQNIPAVQNLARIQAAFPGGPSPAMVVVAGADTTSTTFEHAVEALHQRAAAGGAMHEPVTVKKAGNGGLLVVSVPLAGTGSDGVSASALRTLRTDILPSTLGTVPGVRYAVTGKTAGQQDFSDALHRRTPVVLAFVLVLAFLLLLVAFRSLVIPAVSIALNLLSIGAAYGVLVWVFQQGHGGSVLDFPTYGAVVSWLPLFMFVILFGLSMDYHVFILSRVRELHTRGMDTREAVVSGVGKSAGVVTSAAAIMIAVFSIFATLSVTEYKMVGIGMAVAILIDATVVRGVLLPAAIALFGRHTWSLPRWLNWLPRVDFDAAEPAPAVVRTPAHIA